MSKSELPPIPDRRYFNIGETSRLCGVKPYVLRYWETEFEQLRPAKRRGNRRYYQLNDVLMIRRIRSLLYDHGYTISGARQQLSSEKFPLPEHADQAQVISAAIKDLELLLIKLRI